jgi:hypothetical protein
MNAILQFVFIVLFSIVVILSVLKLALSHMRSELDDPDLPPEHREFLLNAFDRWAAGEEHKKI